MHLGIWEIQGIKNGKLTKILGMKKLASRSKNNDTYLAFFGP